MISKLFLAAVLTVTCLPASAQFEYASAVEDDAKIVIEAIPNCDACERWIENDAVQLLKAGWSVKVDRLKIATPGKLYPRWRICTAGSCQILENVPRGQFMSALQRLLDASPKTRFNDLDFVPAHAAD